MRLFTLFFTVIFIIIILVYELNAEIIYVHVNNLKFKYICYSLNSCLFYFLNAILGKSRLKPQTIVLRMLLFLMDM